MKNRFSQAVERARATFERLGAGVEIGKLDALLESPDFLDD